MCCTSVPTGHILVNLRWQGRDLTTELQASIPIHFENNLNDVDFHPVSHVGVIYICESDVIEGQAYKRRAARLRKMDRLRGVVIVERTDMSKQYFQSLQNFCVSDLGLSLIPVGNQKEAAAFLVQMVISETSLQKNPFATNTKTSSKDASLLLTLSSIPGLGETKAQALLHKFSSLLTLSQASEEELAGILGKASSLKLYNFLHGCS